MITDAQRAQLNSLNRRHRDCLRLVPLRTTDQIAHELGLRSNTVEGYIKEARARLGGLSRGAAAGLLIEWENENPQNVGGQSLGLTSHPDPEAPAEAQHGSIAERATNEHMLRDEPMFPEHFVGKPVKRGMFDRWQSPGEFSPIQRLIIVGGLLTGLSVGFGIATVGVVGVLEVIERLR